jgi:hypothetical protein
VSLEDSVGNQQAEPEEGREPGILEVFVEPADGLLVGILDQVRSVHSPTEPLVEPALDHAPEPIPMASEELIQGGAIPVLSAGQQSSGRVNGFGHGNHDDVRMSARNTGQGFRNRISGTTVVGLERFTIGLHTLDVLDRRTPPDPPFVRGGNEADRPVSFPPPYRRGGQGGCIRISQRVCATQS